MRNPARQKPLRWAVLLLAASAIGCQDEDGFSLAPPGWELLTGAASRTAAADPCVDPSNEETLTREMVEAVNAERTRHGLKPLRADPTLQQLADFYACRLVDGDFFAHQDPFDRSTLDARAANFGYAFLKIGENLAAGQRSVSETLADWMASPTHRANILDPAYTEIGLAVKHGGRFGTYWVQEFGRPITAGEELVTESTRAEQPSAGSSEQPASQPSNKPEGALEPSSQRSAPV